MTVEQTPMSHLTLGPFAVHKSGEIAPRAPDRRPALRFAWRGRPCRAELGADAVRIEAIAARIPSTADPAADRRGALSGLAKLPGNLPDGWRVRLLPDHRVSLETANALDTPQTAVSLLAALVRFALALDPYLDRLEAIGTDAPGRAKTCPG